MRGLRALRPYQSILAIVAGTLVLAEIAVRVLPIWPRVQIVRPRLGLPMSLIDGVPVWEQTGTAERRRADCPERKGPGALRVMAFGSSILFGSGLDPSRRSTAASRACSRSARAARPPA